MILLLPLLPPRALGEVEVVMDSALYRERRMISVCYCYCWFYSCVDDLSSSSLYDDHLVLTMVDCCCDAVHHHYYYYHDYHCYYAAVDYSFPFWMNVNDGVVSSYQQ